MSKFLLPFLLSVFFLNTNNSLSQTIFSGKREYHFQSKPVDINGITLTTFRAHSQKTFTQFELVLNNASDDYYFLKGDFNLFYPGNELNSKPKTNEEFQIIRPGRKGAKTFGVWNKNDKKVMEPFTVELLGLYKVSSTEKILETHDSQILSKKYVFQTGPFTCKLIDIKTYRRKKVLIFSCTYNGTNAGIVKPDKIFTKFNDHQELANAWPDIRRWVFLPGWKREFFVQADLLSDNPTDTLNIIWKDCFIESTPENVKVPPIEFLPDSLTGAFGPHFLIQYFQPKPVLSFNEKGNLNIRTGAPVYNNFHVFNGDKNEKYEGTLGITAGLDYHLSDKFFISGTFGGGLHSPAVKILPYGTARATGITQKKETVIMNFAKAEFNYKWRHFYFGPSIQYSAANYHKYFIFASSPDSGSAHLTSKDFGIGANLGYHFLKYVYGQLTYVQNFQPSGKNTGLKKSSSLYIEIGLKYSIRRKKK